MNVPLNAGGWCGCLSVMRVKIGIFLATAVSMTGIASSSFAVPRPDPAEAAARIDRLIDAKLAEKGIAPNSEVDDATFLRRVYLDLNGRIPLLEEAADFHADSEDGRRGRLIGKLLASEGYVSHFYHFWADILRINARLGINETPVGVEYAYRLWLKKALRDNVPYDEFVRQLVSARGHYWENGAVGYYHRDRGMPLDNMSNTVRIFLGTRLECAQCHNHPFDHWTQMDYYRMAAFSYGMESKGHTHPNREALRAHLEKSVDAAADREAAKVRAKGIFDAEEILHVRVRYVTTREYERVLKLPHDYQYTDAKPFDVVMGKSMFGAEISPNSSAEGQIDAYAAWLTSRENPTFTRVIANRLWSRLFGAGVFEPLDDITENMVMSNPELMTCLEDLMRSVDFDMKAFLAVLCHTRAYQRAASHEEIALGEPYYFQGPALRRMTAEQIWDSIAGMVAPELDLYRPQLIRQLQAIRYYQGIHEGLAGMPEAEYIATLESLGDATDRLGARLNQVRQDRKQARGEKNESLSRQKETEEKSLQNELGAEISRIQNLHKRDLPAAELLASIGMAEMVRNPDGTLSPGVADQIPVVTQMPKPKYPQAPRELNAEQGKEWAAQTRDEYLRYVKMGVDWARASELESPAPRGHFLRDFGQSDRDVIENSSDQASVPQALNLLNGPAVEALTNRFTMLGRRIHAAPTAEERGALIFQAMLTRRPNETEMKRIRDEIARSGEEADHALIWALLNTQRFLFIQ
jgi:hypothetical protein